MPNRSPGPASAQLAELEPRLREQLEAAEDAGEHDGVAHVAAARVAPEVRADFLKVLARIDWARSRTAGTGGSGT